MLVRAAAIVPFPDDAADRGLDEDRLVIERADLQLLGTCCSINGSFARMPLTISRVEADPFSGWW